MELEYEATILQVKMSFAYSQQLSQNRPVERIQVGCVRLLRSKLQSR